MNSGHASNDPPGIAKMPTGIEAFDQITCGGLPRGRTSLIVGGPGCGKTVFALQTLVNGARLWGEPGIFVAFEENSDQIVANAASFGWDLPALQQEKLFFLDARMTLDAVTAGQFDLGGLLAGLEAKAAEMGAQRIVFDSIDVLLTLLDDVVAERRESYRVHDWLGEHDLSGLMTARVVPGETRMAGGYGFMQFMADCVVLLSHRVEERVSLRTLRTLKYRGSGFAENEFPLVIDAAGIEVASPGQEGAAHGQGTTAAGERVSTGVERLDRMLDGGPFRGSTILISGAPGTAKSTLCGAFIEAACRRGEPAMYVSFDETPAEIVRNLASVNVRLAPYVESGLLHIHGFRSHTSGPEKHLVHLMTLLDQQRPRCLALDPLSVMIKAGSRVAALDMVQRLLDMTQARGITVMATSLLVEDNPGAEATPLQISTVADTWIHLYYEVHAGERNRALSIVKSRGTGHSNQVRELILSDEGVTLADVYTAGGEVLMGTLRWEQEEADRTRRQRQQAELASKQKELSLARAEAQARMEAIRRELEALEAEAARLATEQQGAQDRYAVHQRVMRTLRGVDDPPSPPKPKPDGEQP